MAQEVNLHFSGGHYTRAPEEDGKFLLLREMFEKMPNTFISIDCKGGGVDMCDKVYELIIEFKREDLTVWGSMSPANHTHIQKLSANITTFYSAK